MIRNRLWSAAVFGVTMVCWVGTAPAFADEPAP